jgi:hypothetical protein
MKIDQTWHKAEIPGYSDPALMLRFRTSSMDGLILKCVTIKYIIADQKNRGKTSKKNLGQKHIESGKSNP